MTWDPKTFEKTELISGPYPDQSWPTSGSIQFSDTQAIVDVGGHKRLTLEDTGPLVLRDEEGKASLTINTDQSVTLADKITAVGDGVITTHLSATGNITSSGNMSGSATSTFSGGTSTFTNYGGNISGSSTSTLSVGGNASVNDFVANHITASGNISSSGTVTLTLSTTEILTTGSLWISSSGAGAASGSGYLMMFKG